MSVLISMLRGVNVGGHHKIKMDELRALYQTLRFEDPRTYVQSGNVIFRTKEKNSPALTKKIQNAIERKFGFRPEVIIRTTEELRSAIAASPFASGRNLEPGKILVTFLAAEPGPDALASLLTLKAYPEELHLKGRELYIYFPDGAGKSKLPGRRLRSCFEPPAPPATGTVLPKCWRWQRNWKRRADAPRAMQRRQSVIVLL